MVFLKTVTCHQDVLTLDATNNQIFAGVGSYLYVYQNHIFLTAQPIFQGHKVHVIKCKGEKILVVGGRHAAVCVFDGIQITIKSKILCNDWILDMDLFTVGEISSLVLITAHNQVQAWDPKSQELMKKSSSAERCILYSGALYNENGVLFALAGTVFSEVIVWKPNFESDEPCSILMRFTGHKGVIFSITASQILDDQLALATTSDDRSVMLGLGKDLNTLTFHPPLFGHSARVWKAIILPNSLLTVGEDSLLCVWNYDGSLAKKIKLHQGGGIRSVCSAGQEILTGGSDGGIFSCSYVVEDSESQNRKSLAFAENIPRKVKFIGNGRLAVLTDKFLFCDGPKIPLEDEFQGKCTDFQVSECFRFIVLSTISGFLLVYDSSVDKFSSYLIREGSRCESLNIRDEFLLVQLKGGEAVLLVFTPNSETAVSQVRSLIIPKSKERSANCFLRVDGKIVIGDRNGNLHVYEENSETAVQSLHSVHSFLGVSDIFYDVSRKKLLTCGAGGWIKELEFFNGKLEILRSYSIPMESAVRFIRRGLQKVIAGFHSSNVMLYDVENRLPLTTYDCGGGHRSFDFHVDGDKLDFVYIKAKKVVQVTFDIQVGFPVKAGHHTKVINCLKVLWLGEQPIIVSGGDDTTVRIAEINNYDILNLALIEQHISSVRAIHINSLASLRIIISVGGREQLSIVEFDLETQQCREISSRWNQDPVADSRFMCVDSTWHEEDLFIFVGCSDGTIRVFSEDLKPLGRVQYSHCILRLAVMDHFLVSFATDGKATFWVLAGFLSAGGSFPDEFCFQVPLHQSGINSAVVLERFGGETLLITGGDDNMLSLAAFEWQDGQWREVDRWSSSSAHSCQITGLVCYGDWLVSTGVDQRVAVHRLKYEPGKVSAEWAADVVVSVPDAHGLSFLRIEDDQLDVCVYGKGFEVVQIDLR